MFVNRIPYSLFVFINVTLSPTILRILLSILSHALTPIVEPSVRYPRTLSIKPSVRVTGIKSESFSFGLLISIETILVSLSSLFTLPTNITWFGYDTYYLDKATIASISILYYSIYLL